MGTGRNSVRDKKGANIILKSQGSKKKGDPGEIYAHNVGGNTKVTDRGP